MSKGGPSSKAVGLNIEGSTVSTYQACGRPLRLSPLQVLPCMYCAGCIVKGRSYLCMRACMNVVCMYECDMHACSPDKYVCMDE